MTTMEHWPETVVLVIDELLADEAQWTRAISTAQESAQRLELREPIRFGDDVRRDVATLRFLKAATEQYVRLSWRLEGDPPWPLRTVSHLRPPEESGTPLVSAWRRQHSFGLCTYRIGPGFVLLRDSRPDGQKIRAKLTGPWVEVFQRLVSEDRHGADDQAEQLLRELQNAGLALVFGDGRHLVLPTRLSRWPVPYHAI